MKRDFSLKGIKEKEPLKGFERGKPCLELCFGMALVLVNGIQRGRDLKWEAN
jgi:hypothetical protein